MLSLVGLRGFILVMVLGLRGFALDMVLGLRGLNILVMVLGFRGFALVTVLGCIKGGSLKLRSLVALKEVHSCYGPWLH